MRTTKNLFVVFVFALLMLAAATANVFAQEEPESSRTLEETLEFIKNTVDVSGKNVVWGGDAPAEFSFSPVGKCQGRITANFYQSNNAVITGGIVRTFTHTFSFADIDPLSIEKTKATSIYDPAVEYFRIVLQTSKSQKRIEWRDTLDNRVKNTADAIIIVQDSQTADKLVQALKHAAHLCRGKVDRSIEIKKVSSAHSLRSRREHKAQGGA